MKAPRLAAEDLARIREAASAPHPRLFCAAGDRERIAGNTASGACREMAERLRMKCDAYLDPTHEAYLDLDSYDSDALLARPGQYVLSRIMEELVYGGWLLGDSRYTDKGKEIVLRRAREGLLTEYGTDVAYSHFRSPLGVGITGVPLAFAADFLRPALTDAEWADVVDHVRRYYLDYARLPMFERQRLHMTGFNKTIAGMCATGCLALLVAEDLDDEELDEAVSEAVRSAFGYAREGMDDDGGPLEGPGYGGHCIARVLDFAEALRRHGLPTLSRYEPLRRHGQWLASLLVPGGGTVSLGDSHGEANVYPELLLLAKWWDDASLRWAYTQGLGRPDHRAGPYGDHFNLWHGVLPQQLTWVESDADVTSPDAAGWPTTSHCRGYDAFTLRSGWSDDATLAVLTGCGRRSAAPAHIGAEAAALDLWAYGKELLADPGYGYATADAHSCVQVTGHAPVLRGGNALFGGHAVRFADGEFAAVAGVDVAQMLDCRWAFRDVVLLRGAMPYLIVADDLNYRSDWAEYDWFWQALPSAEVRAPDGDGAAAITNGDVCLDIHCHTPAADTYPKPYECTWSVERHEPESWFGRAKEQAELNRLRLHVGGYNGLLLSVLFPHRLGDPGVTVTPLECPHPGVAFTVEGEGFCDRVMFAPYNRFIQSSGCVGCGRLAIVREVDGGVAGHLLVDGYELTWKGEPLVAPQMRAGHFMGG